jgi:hypothetical protein
MDKCEKPSDNSARRKTSKSGKTHFGSNNSNLSNNQFASVKTPVSTVSRTERSKGSVDPVEHAVQRYSTEQ